MIVVDASLFAAWLLNEPAHGPEDAVWDLLSAETLLAPSHWPNEIANALRRGVRTKRLRPDEVAPIAERISTFDIELAPPIAVDEIGGLAADASSHNLSAYDMLYVRLAHERRLRLATIDQPMRAVAQRMKIDLLPR